MCFHKVEIIGRLALALMSSASIASRGNAQEGATEPIKISIQSTVPASEVESRLAIFRDLSGPCTYDLDNTTILLTESDIEYTSVALQEIRAEQELVRATGRPPRADIVMKSMTQLLESIAVGSRRPDGSPLRIDGQWVVSSMEDYILQTTRPFHVNDPDMRATGMARASGQSILYQAWLDQILVMDSGSGPAFFEPGFLLQPFGMPDAQVAFQNGSFIWERLAVDGQLRGTAQSDSAQLSYRITSRGSPDYFHIYSVLSEANELPLSSFESMAKGSWRMTLYSFGPVSSLDNKVWLSEVWWVIHGPASVEISRYRPSMYSTSTESAMRQLSVRSTARLIDHRGFQKRIRGSDRGQWPTDGVFLLLSTAREDGR